MRPTLRRAIITGCLGLLGACAGERDHFYMLNILPEGGRTSLTAPTVHVLLNVDVPALVDRPEMIVNTAPNGITILDHQRWAGTLSDQVQQTLARDLERRRPDVLVADRAFDQETVPPIKIKVDIVRLIAQRTGSVVMEAHWHIVDAAAGVDQINAGMFDSPVTGGGYDAIATAYSKVLSAVADKVAAGIRPR